MTETSKPNAPAPTTALARVVTPPALMRPVASLDEIAQARQAVVETLIASFVEGVDVIKVPGSLKPSLSKAGAEKANLIMGCHPEFSIFEKEIDHDRRNIYADKYGKERTSFGLYRFVVECRIVRNDNGATVGTALASCSTMESKYISRPRDCENTAIRMASKRAYCGASLTAFQLSDRLTSDVEDIAPHDEHEVRPTQAARRAPHESAPRSNGTTAPPSDAPREPPALDTSEGIPLRAVHDVCGRFDGAPAREDLEAEGKAWAEVLKSPLGESIGPRTRWALKLWYARALARLDGKAFTPPTEDGAAMIDLLASSRARAVLETPHPDTPVDGEIVDDEART